MARTKFKSSLTVLPKKPRSNKKPRSPKVAVMPGDKLSKQGARAVSGQTARMPRGF